MKEILNSLVQYEGIQSASLVSLDGVLVASAIGADSGPQVATLSDTELQPVQTMAALASGWIAEVMRSVGPLAWDTPYRCVLRATQKNLVVHAFGGSFLMLVIDPDVDPEDTRSLMDTAIQQLAGHMQSAASNSHASGAAGMHPPGALPSDSQTPLRLATQGDSFSESAGEG